ncbi:MAG: hypothetical protein K9K64_09915 [Desulfohalobiaceae bacterium]|nr:hypothetical protein [Desulfohalobiaceae bacterium]
MAGQKNIMENEENGHGAIQSGSITSTDNRGRLGRICLTCLTTAIFGGITLCLFYLLAATAIVYAVP